MKTLTQLDAKLEKRIPVTSAGPAVNITSSGSYYLTKDIPFTDNGLVITADDVTIDLNGFGVVGSGAGAGNGISLSGAHKNIVVRNGSVRSFGAAGLAMSSGSNCILEDLRVADNKGAGAQIGPIATVIHCNFSSNVAGGLIASSGAAITDCSAFANKSHGIRTANGCIVSRCRALGNSADGFNLGDDAEVTGCVASGNAGSGIIVLGGGAITNCVASANTSYGISTAQGALVTACTARKQFVGIHVGDNAMVSGCNVSENTSEGIQAANGCLISNNIASRNGNFNTRGVGVHLLGTVNRVDSNQVYNNLGQPGMAFGILSEGGANADFVVRNISNAQSPNFKPFTSSTLGPIQQPSDTNASPWANLITQ
jgi:hypothetical protein